MLKFPMGPFIECIRKFFRKNYNFSLPDTLTCTLVFRKDLHSYLMNDPYHRMGGSWDVFKLAWKMFLAHLINDQKKTVQSQQSRNWYNVHNVSLPSLLFIVTLDRYFSCRNYSFSSQEQERGGYYLFKMSPEDARITSFGVVVVSSLVDWKSVCLGYWHFCF